MVTRIRLARFGKKHRPFYRIVVIDGRRKRDGAYIEKLGTYDPFIESPQARIKIDLERYNYWIRVGAQPSATVERLIKHLQQ